MKKYKNKMLKNSALINIKGGVEQDCDCYSTPDCAPGSGTGMVGGIHTSGECNEFCIYVRHSRAFRFAGGPCTPLVI